MVIDFDNKIGKLMNLCAHTLSSFANDDNDGDEINYAPSEASSSFITQTNEFPTGLPPIDLSRPEIMPTTSSSDPSVIHDKTGTFDEMNLLPGYESKIRWLERKLHEQSIKVTEMTDNKSEYEIEMARKKLRVYEIARFRQFRTAMLEKLRPKMAQKSMPLNGIQQKHQSGFAQIREASSSSLPSNQNSALKTATESVDLNIDVQVSIQKTSIFIVFKEE